MDICKEINNNFDSSRFIEDICEKQNQIDFSSFQNQVNISNIMEQNRTESQLKQNNEESNFLSTKQFTMQNRKTTAQSEANYKVK